MNVSKFILLTLLAFTFVSCSDNDELPHKLKDCNSLKDVIVLSEEERLSTCIYNDVYAYQSEIYTLFVCCVCDLIAMPVDCDGVALCDLGDNCIVEFNQKSEFLFSIKSE